MTRAHIHVARCLARGGALEARLLVGVGVRPPGSTNVGLLPGRRRTPGGPRQFCGTGRGSWAQARAAPAPGMPILRAGCVGPVCPGLLTWQKGATGPSATC